jgi:AraC family transcriptional regulator of adaptative response / DNA-3-methyladenine glycosylase II
VFNDPVVQALAGRFPGLRPYCDGSLFDGIVTAIVGQSISVAAAAVTQARLAALFAPPLVIGDREYFPLPRPDQLASATPALIRQSGVTMRRAEALGHAARALLDDQLPDDGQARRDPEGASRALQALPLVGRWTAESALLWGIGAPEAYPTGDIALLRAARQAYAQPAMRWGSWMQWRRAGDRHAGWRRACCGPASSARRPAPPGETTYPISNLRDGQAI